MDDWKSVFFWCFMMGAVVALILGFIAFGVSCENKRRDIEKVNYAECVKRAMDPRECRDVIRKPNESRP